MHSRSSFFAAPSKKLKAAMVATLQGKSISRNWPDALPLTAAVRAYSALMHRNRASFTSSPLMIDQQTPIDRLYVVVGHIAECGVGQISGCLKQRIARFFAHSAIIGRFLARRYSNFPIVVFVHGSTVGHGCATEYVQETK